jgi:hypothetical protein
MTAAFQQNGSCLVTLELNLHLEGDSQNLQYPLPGNARSVTINGNSARTSQSGGLLLVKLSQFVGNVTGDYTLRLQYTLPGLVNYDEDGKLMLTMPILSGFHQPIQGLKFTFTLPGDITTKPAFTSGYYQQTIESNIVYTVDGNTLTGTVSTELKDRENLSMTLPVSEELFPQNPVKQWRIGLDDMLMVILAVLALLYWLIFLRCAPLVGWRSTVPPAGFAAGELSELFAGRGSDLTMMVFSWAQMGYLLIHLQDGRRVILHKRMDMGNERDAEEVRLFRALFGKRRSVDGASYHYANLCKKSEAASGKSFLYKPTSGNPRVFRLLCAGIGVLGGISLGSALAGEAVLGVLLMALLAALGGISAWVMQDWVKGLHLRDKSALYLGLGLALVWCLLGLVTGILNVTACVAGAQLLCGLAAAYGGRRTAIGRQTLSQALGLRRYLKKLPPKEALRVLRHDPEYFFDMAPYAMALGVGKEFSAAFKKKRLGACPWLTTGMDGHMTASEWYRLMLRTEQLLDARQKRLFLERLTGR